MKFTLPILFFFTGIHMFSQTGNQVNVDSLVALKKTKKLNVEGQIMLHEQLYSDNFYTNTSKALKHNDSLYIISKKHNHKTGMANYYSNIAFNKYLDLDYDSALSYCKKANKLFIEDKNYNKYLFSINRQCMYLESLNRNKESLNLATRHINLFKNHSKLPGLGDLYLYLANYYSRVSRYKSALIYTKSALSIYQKAKYYHGIVKCDVMMGLISQSLENYSDALFYFKRLNDLPPELRNVDDYKLQYLLKMVEVHISLKKYSESIEFSNKLLFYLKKKPTLALYVIYIQLCKADAYQKLNKINESLKIIRVAEKDIKKHLNDPEVGSCLKYINEIKSNIYLDFKQYKLALQTLQKNLKLKNVEIHTYKDISNIQFKLKLYEDAYENLQLYNKKKIEQLTNNQKNSLDDLQLLYNSKDSEFKIQDLKLKKAKDELQLNQEKSFSNKIIVALVLLLLFVVFLYYNFRVKKKVGQILRYKNNKLEKINTLLNKSNKDKEVLLKEIHHRVKNNLQLVSSILYIQANDFPDISVSEFYDECQNRISSIALIHQNLYLTENLDSVGFQQYLEDLSSSIVSSFSGKKQVVFEINANDSYFNIQTAISLGLIISELSCNSIKHAFKDKTDGIIFLEINKIDDTKFELIAGDNGCGNLSSSSSSNSMGLELVRLLVMQLNGEIEKLNRQGSFYKITFEEIEK